MSEINPYESPQSDQLPRAEEPRPEEPWPSWLGRALWTQFFAILLVIFAAPIPFAPANQPTWNLLMLGVVGFVVALSLVILSIAMRYRIGWLVLLESIIIGLPLTAYINSVRN